MFHETIPLRFECTGCGRCCATRGDYYVFLTEDEAERIRRHLKLSRAWFRRRYLARHPDGDRVLAMSPDERCIFLDADNRCRIYAARPLQCRTYPWWPEVVRSQASWMREAHRCEGIGRGAVVAVEKIRKALKSGG